MLLMLLMLLWLLLALWRAAAGLAADKEFYLYCRSATYSLFLIRNCGVYGALNLPSSRNPGPFASQTTWPWPQQHPAPLHPVFKLPRSAHATKNFRHTQPPFSHTEMFNQARLYRSVCHAKHFNYLVRSRPPQIMVVPKHRLLAWTLDPTSPATPLYQSPGAVLHHDVIEQE
jgi:hypothetical protein